MRLAGLALALGPAGLFGLAEASPRVFPTGVTLYDPACAWNGCVAFGAPDGRSYLIDVRAPVSGF